MKVRHAVILMAGKGTRFLPATKAVAKELFPVGNKPALLFQLQECLDSGIEEVTIVISKQKKDVIKFLKHDKELEDWLVKCGKEKYLEEWKNIIDNLKINFTYQGKLIGSGGAIMTTKKYTKGEPFVVLFGDDVCVPQNGSKPATKELIELYEKTGKYVLGALRVRDEVVDRYGVIIPGDKLDERTTVVKGFKEKPKKGEQPSNIASLASYLVLPEVYDNIMKLKPAPNGELLFPEAIAMEVDKDKVLALEFGAKYWDLGNKLEFIKCSIAMGLEDKEIQQPLKEFLNNFRA